MYRDRLFRLRRVKTDIIININNYTLILPNDLHFVQIPASQKSRAAILQLLLNLLESKLDLTMFPNVVYTLSLTRQVKYGNRHSEVPQGPRH